MPNLNLLVYLNAYGDKRPTNNPSKSFFKWERAVNSLPIDNATSLEFELAPGETRVLFNGSRTLTQDNTTQYNIALAAGETSIYQLTWVGGTSPTFRTARTSGANATTQVTVTLNGPVATFTSTGGTLFNLTGGGVVVGDFVRIGNLFNSLNQGEWQIISLTATSFSVANLSAAAEGPITLGSGFASQIDIYSAAGVQIGDTLNITGGFSPVTQGSYKITGVSDTFIRFSSVGILPTETITTQSISVYSEAKNLVYLESDQNVSIVINNTTIGQVHPLSTSKCCGPGGSSSSSMSSASSLGNIPGVFMFTSTVYSLSVINNSINTAKLFFAAVE